MPGVDLWLAVVWLLTLGRLALVFGYKRRQRSIDDARIWAAAGSIPLYQRPQLYAARPHLANAGAFGFQTPVYEDMGFLKKGATAPGSPARK